MRDVGKVPQPDSRLAEGNGALVRFPKVRRSELRRVAKENSPIGAWHAQVYAEKLLLALGARAGTVPMVAFTHDTGGGKWRRASGEISSGVRSLFYTSP